MAIRELLLLVTLCHLLSGVLTQQNWAAQLRDEMNATRIEEFLRILTQKPHMAGTQDGHDLADYVRRTWLEQGLDSAHIAPYDVLLSYPHPDRLSYVALLDDDSGNEIFRSSGEPPLFVDPPANISSVVRPYAAYSPSGVVEGGLVYVNYGRSSDFDLLESEGISVQGNIAICRYGKTALGRKVRRAQDRGAIGMIVYSDPQEVVGTGSGDTQMYPNGWYAPGTAVRRGHFLYGTGQGEPLTPGYPATDYAYRIDQSKSDQLPTIPVHVIGYKDAKDLLGYIEGSEVPFTWRGLLNIDYRFGPDLQSPASKVRLNVSVETETRTIHNVVGIIRGREADRYVVLGNHRDAWNLGAVDPNSGTACLLEITRALGVMMAGGWRPRRTLMFVSWDAEEHGMHGSFEWIEEFGKIMSNRAVAYLNVDNVQDTHTLRARATPSLKPLLKEAAKKVPWPVSTNHGDTLYEVWSKRRPPKIDLPASASDYVPFVRRIGVPILDLALVHEYTNGELTEEFGDSTQQADCSSGYQMHNSICYKAFNDQKNFRDASSTCVADGGTLAMPKDAGTDDFLLSLTNAVDWSGPFRFGLVDLHQEGVWEWMDGTPLGSYRAWGPGEPNDNGDGEDCAEYNPLSKWNDVPCSLTDIKFICQKIPAGCPDGYIYHEPSSLCYKAINDMKTYDASDATCASDGGTLAMPRDSATNNFLINLKNAIDDNGMFRFGLTRGHEEDSWMWDDNLELGSFRPWGPEEPNNYQGNEDCVEYSPGTHPSESHKNKWNDVDCTAANRKFICQVKPSGCPLGYSQHGPKCYKVNDEKKTYDDAAVACRAAGGSLAMPSDEATHQFLVTLKNKADKDGSFWLGFDDYSEEGEWRYINGTHLGSFRRWCQDEPNNNGGNEDCGMINPDPNNCWNDQVCNKEQKFICETSLHYTYPNYPLYHTAYETFHLQKSYIDPDFKFHRLMSQLWGDLALSLAESQILPIDPSEYADTVQGMYDRLVDEYGNKFAGSAISLDALDSAVTNFSRAAMKLAEELSTLGNDSLVARMYNDQLMQMERAFLDPLGLPDAAYNRTLNRHTILSSSLDLYTTDTFPALGDAIRRMGSNWSNPGKADTLNEIKEQLSIITFFIQSAANTLAKPASTVF